MEHRSFAVGKFQEKKTKEEFWEQFVQSLNADRAGPSETAENWKKDIRSKNATDVAETGEKEASKPLNMFDKIIVDIIGQEAVDDIKGVRESREGH